MNTPTRRSTPWGAILSLITAVVYGASPIDLLPDLIPILGLVDDVIAVPLLILFAIILYRRRQRADARQVITVPARSSAPTAPPIPVAYDRLNG